MSFSSLHKLVAYLLSGLGLIALSLGSELSGQAMSLMFLAYVGSFFAEGKLLGRPYYAKGWTVAVVAVLLLQFARAAATEPTLSMAIEFAAFLQISRLWNRRTAVDYQQIAVLSFLHLIAATVLSTNLSYALIFVGFVIATPWMLALSQLRREIEGNYPASAPNDEKAQAAVQRVLASKRVVGASFLISTASLAVPLFAMTLTIFVVVPRVGQGFLSLQRNEGQRVTGFGNQIELGGFGVIRDDPTVVLRVTPLAKPAAENPLLSLRMRGTSFDHYDGKRWTRSPSVARSLPNSGRGDYVIRRPADPSRDRGLRIILDHLDEAVVFLPYGTVALNVPPRIVNAEPVARELTHAPGLDVRYTDPDELGLVYTAYVSPDPAEAELLSLAPERRARYLQLPPGHERVAELAKQVTAGLTEPSAMAASLVRYLHSSRFTYSLEQPDVKDQPPLVAFLFDAKRGHCEYFASAMAIMLRELGIPSRNVTGFVGGRYNPYGGYYALRQGDAHSWVEAYLDGRGWVTFDPTPPARAALGPSQSLWADMQALVDALRTRWMTSVVGYDLRTQVGILRRIARFFSQQQMPGSGTSAELNALGNSALYKRFARNGLFILAALGAIGFAIWRLRRRKLTAAVRALSPSAAAAVKLYHELEEALSACGEKRPAAITPNEHARALEQRGFACAAEVREITERYMEARYGEASLRKQDLPGFYAKLARVRAVKNESPRARS